MSAGAVTTTVASVPPAVPGAGSTVALAPGATEPVVALLVLAVLLVAVLGAAVLVLTTRRRRAERRAEQATRELRSAQDDAERHARLLAAVVDSLGEGVVLVDGDGEYLLSNRAARAILGVEGVDVVQWPDRLGLSASAPGTPPATQELPLAQAMAALGSDASEVFVRSQARPEGFWLEASARVLDPGAGLAGAVAVFHDVTARRTAHDAVRASEEQLRLLLDGARDHAIVMLDPQGLVQTWSTNAERITGYTEAEVLGQPYAIFSPAGALEGGKPARDLEEAALTGRVESGDLRVRKDGSTFWARVVLTPVHDAAGALRGFVDVMRDMTATRQADERFRDLLEAAPDAIVGCSEDGRIVFANSKVDELFGYCRSELLGQPLANLVPELVRPGHGVPAHDVPGHGVPAHDVPGHVAPLDAPHADGPTAGGLQLSARRRDGSSFPAEITLSTLHAEDGLILSAAIRDISDRVQAQGETERLNRALRDLNTELELRVHERTAQLEDQAQALRAANAELEAFSYSVSHDLRAPLRAVDGFAAVLAMDHADQLDDAGRRYLGKVRSGAQQMGHLIDGLLAFSRLQLQDMSAQSVDLAALVDEVWEELTMDRSGRDVSLRVGSLPLAHGDPRLLRHVVGNLLGNAVKYSRAREHAHIEVEGRIDEDGASEYAVRDNGTGFDMRYADKVFEVFQRLHHAEDYEGTGVGLALASRIVARHGGRLRADAEPDVGATFTFTLPNPRTTR